MHVLIVTAEYIPNVTSGVNRLKFLSRMLIDKEIAVTVITADPRLYGMSPVAAEDGGENIIRTGWLRHGLRRALSSRYFPIFDKLSIPDKYFHWKKGAIKEGIRLAKRQPIDLIVGSYPGYTNIEVATKLAEQLKIPLLIDFRDPPQISSVAKNKKELRQIEIVLQACEQAGSYTAATKSTIDVLSKTFLNRNKPVSVIPNGYDKEVVDSVLSQTTTKSDEVFNIIHIGSFYPEGRDICLAIEALEKYANAIPNDLKYRSIRLTLVGELPPRAMLNKAQTMASALRLVVQPPCSNLEALQLANSAHALLLLQGTEFDAQVPAKAYEYLALQRPIWALVGVESESNRLMGQYPDNVVYADYAKQHDIDGSVDKLVRKSTHFGDYQQLSRAKTSELFLEPILSLIAKSHV